MSRKILNGLDVTGGLTVDGFNLRDYANFRGQARIIGGGTVSWGVTASKVKWSSRFLIMPVPYTEGSDRYIAFVCPTTGVTDTSGAERADANGITLTDWDSLWVVHTRGGNSGAGFSMKVVPYNTTLVEDYFRNENAFMICVRYGDGASALHFTNGLIIPHGQTATAGGATQSQYLGATATAAAATKLATARTISLTGSVTGSGSFDGSGNLSIATDIASSYAGAGKVNPADVDTSGFYFGFASNDAVNYPATYGSLFGYQDASNSYGYSYQIYRGHSGQDLYLRYANNSAWSPWHRLWHSGNFTPGDYLPLTGGTLTGAVTGTSFNSITGLSSTTPAAPGTAAVGTATTAARADHVHAIPTKANVESVLTGAITSHTHSYLPLSGGTLTGGLSGTTAAFSSTVTGTSFNSITGLSSTAPAAPAASASIGTATTVARADHAHARPTKSDVEAVLTGGITSHTHSYLPLSGGALTGGDLTLFQNPTADMHAVGKKWTEDQLKIIDPNYKTKVPYTVSNEGPIDWAAADDRAKPAIRVSGMGISASANSGDLIKVSVCQRGMSPLSDPDSNSGAYYNGTFIRFWNSAGICTFGLLEEEGRALKVVAKMGDDKSVMEFFLFKSDPGYDTDYHYIAQVGYTVKCEVTCMNSSQDRLAYTITIQPPSTSLSGTITPHDYYEGGYTRRVGQLFVHNDINAPSVLLEGASSGWGSGIQLNNTSVGGRKWGFYADTSGNLRFSDVTGSTDKMILRAGAAAQLFHNGAILDLNGIDHSYMQMICNGTRWGWVGFGSTNTTAMALSNDRQGEMHLNTYSVFRITSTMNSKQWAYGTDGYAYAPTGGGWVDGSDRRFKTNITSLDHGMDFISKLNPCSFNFIQGGEYRWGLIAQEVSEALESIEQPPEIYVSEDPNGMLGVNYPALVVPLIKAVQELDARVKELESRLTET